MKRKWVSLAAFLVLVAGGGLVIGYVTAPGEWYARLAKPAFNPPAWVFGPAWTTLYILIAVAGWRVWWRDRGGWAMSLWWVQLGLNFAWSPVFFSAHRIGWALVIVFVLLAVILAFMAAARRRDQVAAWLFAPYAAWVAFASLLNASIWSLN
jgi:translocator protein